jgi:hypothetical protein
MRRMQPWRIVPRTTALDARMAAAGPGRRTGPVFFYYNKYKFDDCQIIENNNMFT